MSENTTPAAVGSSAELGLAPERANLPPQIGRLLKQGQRFGQPVYSAEQMYAYAAQEVAAERERCAALCETAPFTGNTFPVTQTEQLRRDIAAAILGPNP